MAKRCASCGRFNAGPFIDYSEDSSDYYYGRVSEWVGTCCQAPADRERGGDRG
jgi:hypothetical protein